MLIDAFQEFYKGDLSISEMSKEINDFKDTIEFEKFPLELMKKASSQHETHLRSSGSTSGIPKIYPFSDHRIIIPIEHSCKYPHGKPYVIRMTLSEKNYYISQELEQGQPHFNRLISFSAVDATRLKMLLKDLDDILHKNENIILWNSDQNNLMYLASNNEFYEFMIQNASRISLLNTGITAFFKQRRLREAGVHINDNMIDWYSGLNFYTCKHHNKHVLPMFFMNDRVSTNLLNISRRGEMVVKSDQFDIEPTFMCQCGKRAYNLQFIPHRRVTPTIYMPDIAEMIVGSYYNMQFVQISESELEVHYTGELINYDRELIVHHCEPFQVTFKSDSVFSINHKHPVFHRVRSNRQFL